MKKIIILLMLTASSHSLAAYTPTTYFNRLPHNIFLPFGLKIPDRNITPKIRIWGRLKSQVSSWYLLTNPFYLHSKSPVVSSGYDVYGASLTLHHDLDTMIPGFYCEAHAPLAFIEDSIGIKITDKNNPNTQETLKGRLRAGGIADLDLLLGFRILNKEECYAALSLDCVIPTGNNQTFNKKNQIISLQGNGGHFAPGGGIDFIAKTWGNEEHNIKFITELKYHFLIQALERRTVIIKKPTTSTLSLNTNITPGNQFDIITGFAYNYGGLFVGLGTNYHYQEGETATLNVQQLANAINAATSLARLEFDIDKFLSFELLKIYGDLGYTVKKFPCPVFINIGGDISIVGRNISQVWDVAVKAGIKF